MGRERQTSIFRRHGTLLSGKSRKSCNACWSGNANCAEQMGFLWKSMTSANSQTSTDRGDDPRLPGRRSCRLGSEKRWWSVPNVTMTSPTDDTMDHRQETTHWRAGCVERCKSGSEGGGWKSACKGNSLAAYPTVRFSGLRAGQHLHHEGDRRLRSRGRPGREAPAEAGAGIGVPGPHQDDQGGVPAGLRLPAVVASAGETSSSRSTATGSCLGSRSTPSRPAWKRRSPTTRASCGPAPARPR